MIVTAYEKTGRLSYWEAGQLVNVAASDAVVHMRSAGFRRVPGTGRTGWAGFDASPGVRETTVTAEFHPLSCQCCAWADAVEVAR